MNKAIALSSKLKREDCPELKEHTTAEQWTRESWDISVKDVYLRGALGYGKTAETAVLLSDGYTKNLKVISENRVTVAGYRLAALMREVVKTP